MNSVKSGAGSDDVYKPSLWYFDELAFLRDQELQQEGVSSLDDGEQDGNEGSIDHTEPSTSATESQRYILIPQRGQRNVTWKVNVTKHFPLLVHIFNRVTTPLIH
ncbi:hypothetical protein O3P69_006728 [Scylla paramamosain]|uniref:Uncharacterized protein n=1 Tax=Scylla paramamosain TaxID=85552 RepID=A0AAW0U2G3_SCYPA